MKQLDQRSRIGQSMLALNVAVSPRFVDERIQLSDCCCVLEGPLKKPDDLALGQPDAGLQLGGLPWPMQSKNMSTAFSQQ